MQESKMRVVTLKSKEDSLVVNDEFEYTLENMQKAVGGYIQPIYIRTGGTREIIIWVNEEGILDNLPTNFALIRKKGGEIITYVLGDVLITASDGEDTVGLNDEELEFVKSSFDFDYGTLSPVFASRTFFVK